MKFQDKNMKTILSLPRFGESLTMHFCKQKTNKQQTNKKDIQWTLELLLHDGQLMEHVVQKMKN